MLHYVYIIRCEGNRLYTGYTTDLYRRFTEHCIGKGAKFTRAFKPLAMVYADIYLDKSGAMKEEARIKKLPKHKKEQLIDHTFEHKNRFNLFDMPYTLERLTGRHIGEYTASALMHELALKQRR